MSQTVTQNNVLSKKWVKCTMYPPLAQPTCTLRAGPAVSWLVAGHVAGLAMPYHRHGRPYRRPVPAVSWPCVAACPGVLLRVVSQTPWPCRAHWRPYRGASCAVSQHNGRPPQLRYNDCIVTRPLAKPCTHALPHALRANRPYRRPYRALIRPCRGLSRPYRGRVPCACFALCYPVSQYKNSIVTQIGKRGSSPSSFVSEQILFFFSSHHIFFIPATGKPPNLFFHFPVNQINLLKFILSIFFPVLHIVKPKKKFLRIISFSFFH